jgi:hypothetical protein
MTLQCHPFVRTRAACVGVSEGYCQTYLYGGRQFILDRAFKAHQFYPNSWAPYKGVNQLACNRGAKGYGEGEGQQGRSSLRVLVLQYGLWGAENSSIA